MSEGIQITIPDFDDTDYGSSTIPFGRSAGNGFGFGGGFGSSGFGGSFGAGSSGQDSPTTSTPTLDRSERSFFGAHTRGDSVTSIESSNSASLRYANRSTTSFGHSSNASIAAPSSNSGGFTKKTSFASIRAAFKSGGKSSEAPPVPQMDNSILKSPFNRSTSSLNNNFSATSPLTMRNGGGSTSSPIFGRPATPGGYDTRRTNTRSKGHGYAKSQASSFFPGTEPGDSFSYSMSSSPPPLPRIPNGLNEVSRSETPELEDDKVVMDPKTPSEFALHAVFMRFATSAEAKIETFLRQSLDQDPLLPDFIGAGADPAFDDTLASLGKIAQKHANSVVDPIMRWRRSQLENVGSELIRFHTSQQAGTNRNIRPSEIPALLNERKSLASIYVMCRALIAVLQSLSKDGLGDKMGFSLEKTTFEQFKTPDLKLLLQSANHRTNAELYAMLLGQLSNVRFVSVTDRFLAELGPISNGQVPKDLDMKYENLVRGLRHIQIKVWPPEAFEDGAEFLARLSKAFANAHGSRLKTTFAESLVYILHPIGKTAQAETNNPLWAKAIEIIYPKAREMASKPRYWSAAFPLVITSLCVAPDNLFRKYWVLTFEGAISKLKEKTSRTIVMNGLLRLIWTYLYRCQESASTTTSKLDHLLKYFFPPNRLAIFPSDEHLEPFIHITHFVLSRHFEYGRDLCLELMQESAVNSAGNNIGSVVAPERTAIALQAILLSLNLIEREASAPTWPSNVDFSVVPSWKDYPSSSEFCPPSLLSRPSLQAFHDRFGTTLRVIAVACNNSVGQMSMFDEQWAYNRVNVSYEETHNYVIKRHPEAGSIAYPSSFVPQISLLQTCFQAWPRCLHSSLPMSDAVDMLLYGIIHVEPLIGEVASIALKRFIKDQDQVALVLSRFNTFLFFSRPAAESAGVRLLVESNQLLSLWFNVVETWMRSQLKKTREVILQDERFFASLCAAVEAGALFLLTHESKNIHLVGVKIVRLLGLLASHLAAGEETQTNEPLRFLCIVGYLHGKHLAKEVYLNGFDELLEPSDRTRLDQWRRSPRDDVPLRIADSSNDKDRKLWRYILPLFLQACMDGNPPSLPILRDIIVAAASKYHPTISHLAGLSVRAPTPHATRSGPLTSEKDGARLIKDNKGLIDQWHIWVKTLCATASLPDTSRPALTIGREHSRAPSDISYERERLTTTRGLFRHLTPFLDSEYTLFRDAAVLCISSFPSNAYPQLLEDLSLLAGRQFYDDPRSKSATGINVEQNLNMLSARQGHDEMRSKQIVSAAGERSRRQERLHSAVARIYYLTAHNLQVQRGTGRQAALASVLKFVRNTQMFLTLPDMRDNYTLQRLRRYFCGTVERLFDGLSALKDSDRFIPPQMHLTLYRLCEEWCQFGPQSEAVKQRQSHMQRCAAAGTPQIEASEAIDRFQNETLLLSYAAVGALCSLCQKAFTPPGISSDSPTERQSPEHSKPLTSSAVLERLSAILTSGHEPTQKRGKRALRALLAHNPNDLSLLDEALRRSVVLTEVAGTNCGRFFEVVSELACSPERPAFTFAQIVSLGLSNLCHPLLETRRAAFNILESIHLQTAGILAMSQFEATVSSLAPGTYIHAHRLISEFLAGEHPDEAAAFLTQVGMWLPQLPQTSTSSSVILLLLQSLSFWIPNVQLMTEDKTVLSEVGYSALYHLMALTLRYGQSHTEQIFLLWTRLVDPPNQSNGHATIRFLLEQSHKVGSIVFINCAANIVACLCQTAIGPEVFEDLCSVIEPARTLPTIEHKLNFPNSQDMALWSDLGILFEDEQPRMSLGSAQFAWLFLVDVSLQRYWDHKAALPILLHSLFSHLDHRSSFVRQKAKRMLFLLLRSWAPGYDEIPDRSAHRNRLHVKTFIADLEIEAEQMYWVEEDKSPESKMKTLFQKVVGFLEPLCPTLRDKWASLALLWGTSCSIRGIAFRSLQIFRALMSQVKMGDFAMLLGRLSSTIASTDDNIQSFTTEIILTTNSVVMARSFDPALLPQLFWSACASLKTTVETEFSHVLDLVDTVVNRIDFDDPKTIDHLLSHRPLDWDESMSLQRCLLPGLRSAVTYEHTMKILRSLSKFKEGRVIDHTDQRVRDLYVVTLPWCLQAMSESPKGDNELREFTQNLADLARQEGRTSIAKIMSSFSKNAFRTKDDFQRQSVACLREHYGSDRWAEVVTLLMGLVLNRERWVRIQTMQILKVLFQQRETRTAVEVLGSEILMPLLRLLETDLASQALDVLEEPMIMSGGLAAKHVLRMSMHSRIQPMPKDVDAVATVFGVPEESGWCVVQEERQRVACRANVMAVFDTCQISSRPSQIVFEPEVETLADVQTPGDAVQNGDELGGLVQNLHELTSFFQDDVPRDPRTRPSPNQPNAQLPNRRLEARVAAILAKSTAAEVALESDVPPTPFVDVFRVGSMYQSDEDSDEYSNPSDSELDAFIFDTPAIYYRNTPNGTRYH